MAYDTGNPIGSTDARDLSDNAQNLDIAVNGNQARWTDRLGVSRPTWAGMSHYNDIGAYAGGLEITGYNEIFIYSGEYYRAKASTVLPYTTIGTWSTDDDYFVSIGDAALRQDIVNSADTTIGHYRNAVNCNQYGGLNAAFASSDTLGKIIVVTDAQAMTANIDTAGRGLVVEYGGMITTTAHTLTIAGPFKAGRYQVFAGDGDVAFKGGLTVEAYPEWWGADPSYIPGTDTGGDSTAAFQKCADSLYLSQDRLLTDTNKVLRTIAFIISGCYKITSTVIISGDLQMKGRTAGVWVSTPMIVHVPLNTTDPAITFRFVGMSCRVENVSFSLRSTVDIPGSYFFYNPAGGTTSLYFHRNHIGGYYGKGAFLYLESVDDVEISGNVFDISSETNGTVRIDTGTNIRISGNDFFRTTVGINLTTSYSGVVINNNTFWGAVGGTAPNRGVLLDCSAASDVTISGNSFRGVNNSSDNQGVYIKASTAELIINSSGNTFNTYREAFYFITGSNLVTLNSNGDFYKDCKQYLGASAVTNANIRVKGVNGNAGTFIQDPSDTSLFPNMEFDLRGRGYIYPVPVEYNREFRSNTLDSAPGGTTFTIYPLSFVALTSGQYAAFKLYITTIITSGGVDYTYYGEHLCSISNLNGSVTFTTDIVKENKHSYITSVTPYNTLIGPYHVVRGNVVTNTMAAPSSVSTIIKVEIISNSAGVAAKI